MGRFIIYSTVISLVAFLFLPTIACAGESQDNALSVKALVQEVRTLLTPILEHNSSRLLDRVPEGSTTDLDKESAREKVLNLLSNAIVHAPEGAEIKADYSTDCSTFYLWVENKTVSQHVKREVVDTAGNSFNIEMFPGSGTLYSMALIP